MVSQMDLDATAARRDIAAPWYNWLAKLGGPEEQGL